MASRERLTLEVYNDILRSIHLLHKAGKKATSHNLGHEAAVPYNRLKKHVTELAALGLVDSDWNVTKAGYEFCEEYRKQVAPFLRKYGLGGKD